MPEPFLALLCFVWGIWLYDGFFNKNSEQAAASRLAEAPLQQELTLRHLDRVLRLSDALAGRPSWQRLLAGQADRTRELDLAIETLAAAKQQGGGLVARCRVVEAVVLHAAGRQSPAKSPADEEAVPDAALARAALGHAPPSPADWQALAGLLGTPQARWWHIELARQLTSRPGAPALLAAAIAAEDRKSSDLLDRTLWARGAVAFITLAGLFGVPGAVRLLRRALRSGASPLPCRYPERWPLPLVLAVFLLAELAGIGLTVAFGVLHGGESELPLAALLPLDTLLRVLPCVIALALLFHRPGHFLQRLGMTRAFPPLPVLGLFTLLSAANFGLLQLLGPWLPVDPTGGLDRTEENLGGLVFLLVSACLVAPAAEETLYRGVLFQGFRNRLGVLPAALASAAMFSVVHFYDAFGTASVFLLGLACALAYRATASLAAIIAFHALYNLCLTVPDWILHHSPL